MRRNQFTVVDLFAGCGGFSLGLEMAGFQPVFVNELNPDALATYTRNRLDAHPHLAEAGFHCNDVKQMVVDDGYLSGLAQRLNDTFGIADGELDLLVGGPPCQGFSGIGYRRSYSVDKKQLPSNHLYQDMAYVIHRLRPRTFIFENVRGLLNARWSAGEEKGKIFEHVLAAFAEVPGYRVSWQLVFAKDYGVPQNRPRVLVVGVRNDVVVADENMGAKNAVERGFLPQPTPCGFPDIQDILGDLVDPDYLPGAAATISYPSPASTAIQRWMRTGRDGKNIAKKGSPVSEHEYSKHGERVVAKFQAMLEHPSNEIPKEFRTKKFAQRVLPSVWGTKGPTITATSLPDDYVHFSQPRSLTVREWARLQTFPDWYEFSGKRTTGGIRRAGNPREGVFDRELPKYTQIGNAVPVKMAEAIGKHIANILKEQKK